MKFRERKSLTVVYQRRYLLLFRHPEEIENRKFSIYDFRNNSSKNTDIVPLKNGPGGPFWRVSVPHMLTGWVLISLKPSICLAI